jgi:hypothetical protein
MFSEAPDKFFRLASHALAGDCLHDTKYVLGAMIGLTHQKANLLAIVTYANKLALGNNYAPLA